MKLVFFHKFARCTKAKAKLMKFLQAQHGHVTAPSDQIGSAHIPAGVTV